MIMPSSWANRDRQFTSFICCPDVDRREYDMYVLLHCCAICPMYPVLLKMFSTKSQS